jgi:hypothetical protein
MNLKKLLRVVKGHCYFREFKEGDLGVYGDMGNTWKIMKTPIRRGNDYTAPIKSSDGTFIPNYNCSYDNLTWMKINGT